MAEVRTEMKIVTAPDGRPGALIQFDDSYVIFCDPDELREFILDLKPLWKLLKKAKKHAR